MPAGSNLTVEHQRRAGAMPRVKLPQGAARKANPNESLEDATLRLQQAKADTETLDAQKRELDLAVARGKLIPVSTARDNLEREHLRWVAELDQLPHSVASVLPPEIPASVRDLVRAAVESECLALRQRFANG